MAPTWTCMFYRSIEQIGSTVPKSSKELVKVFPKQSMQHPVVPFITAASSLQGHKRWPETFNVRIDN